VRSEQAWQQAVDLVVAALPAAGLSLVDSVASQLPGPKGNREFFVRATRDK